MLQGKVYGVYFSPTGGTRAYVTALAGLLSCEAEEIDLTAREERARDHVFGPEDLVILQESFDEMWKRVQDQLSEFEAKILGFYLDGLSYQEIAIKVRKSPKSVDNAVQRIRRKVAQHIHPGEISKC